MRIILSLLLLASFGLPAISGSGEKSSKTPKAETPSADQSAPADGATPAPDDKQNPSGRTKEPAPTPPSGSGGGGGVIPELI